MRFLLVLLSVFLVGCGDGKSSGPDKELEAYGESISLLANEEQSILDTYASVIGENYTDDATFFAVIVELIPRTNAFIGELESIRPPTQLRDTHEKWIRAWNLQSSAFILFRAAIQQGDVALVAEGNEKLDEARRLLREVLIEFEELTP